MNESIKKQVGGSHYRTKAIQPWEVIEANGMGFFDGNALKYLMRFKDKSGVEDLRKCIHYLEKLIEMEMARPLTPADRGEVVAMSKSEIEAQEGWCNGK